HLAAAVKRTYDEEHLEKLFGLLGQAQGKLPAEDARRVLEALALRLQDAGKSVEKVKVLAGLLGRVKGELPLSQVKPLVFQLLAQVEKSRERNRPQEQPIEVLAKAVRAGAGRLKPAEAP